MAIFPQTNSDGASSTMRCLPVRRAVVAWVVVTLTLVGAAARAQPPLSVNQARLQARQLIAAGRPEAALGILQPLAASNAKDGHTRLLIGEAYFAMDEFPKAVAAFEEGLTILPDYRGKVFNLGRAYRKLGKLEDADRVFAAMIQEKDAGLRAKGWLGKGLDLLDRGKDVKASHAFEESVRADPDEYRSHYQLGLLALRAGDFERAIRELRIVVKRRPLHHGAAYNLALALGRAGHEEEANTERERYRRILESKEKISGLKSRIAKNPFDVASIVTLARMYRDLGDPRQALRSYQRALQLRRNDPTLLMEAAAVLVDADQESVAEQIYRGLLQRRPPIREAAPPLVKLLEKSGRDVEAKELRRRWNVK